VTITDDAQELLHQRGVLVVPDSVASAGAAIASWVDFFSGTVEQGLGAIDRILTETARQVLRESQRRGVSARRVVMDLVRERIVAARGQTAKSFEQTKAEIGEILGLWERSNRHARDLRRPPRADVLRGTWAVLGDEVAQMQTPDLFGGRAFVW